MEIKDKVISENFGDMVSKLEQFLTSKTVVGEKIVIGDTTLIPFVTITFGGGLGSGGAGESNGTGGGMAASMKPTAILVIRDGTTELLPIGKNSGLEKLVEMIPGIVEKVTEHHTGKEEKKAECCE